MTDKTITVLGAGLAGSLMGILLAKRGIAVKVLERRPDLRRHDIPAGRSINLALADRGIQALKAAGVFDAIAPLLLPMPGRCVHDIDGHTQFIRYGQRAQEVIYSVSRPGLNQALLNCLESLPNVTLQFDVECTDIDFNTRRLHVRNDGSTRASVIGFDSLIGADGAGSVVRHALVNTLRGSVSNEMLPHGYKELTLPAANGVHQLDPRALHVWPRGQFMLIALPNLDGSFTVTLFLPFASSAECPASFEQLHHAAAIESFFSNYFRDALDLMPALAQEFMTHPTGKMGTVRCSRWTDANSALLIGDAAHAIVPFHGQGMNCAFEDCIELDVLLQLHPFARACERFEQQRKPNAHAIAEMALENYIEMRDTVRHPKFLLQKELSFELERRFPNRFIPRYSMVMFHHEISYAEAYRRGQLQTGILDELTAHAGSMQQVDFDRAAILVETSLPELAARPETT